MGEDPQDQQQVIDQIIDGYIQNLEDTKHDPEKRKKFEEEYMKALHKGDDDEPSLLENDPLNEAEVVQPSRGRSEDDGPSPVVPRGDPDAALQNASSEEDEQPDEKPKRGSRSAPAVDLAQFDDSVRDDAAKLVQILTGQKIKGIEYIVKNYFKRAYRTTGSAARQLNKLLTDVGATPRIRRIILNTFFDISRRTLDEIFAEEEESDDDEDVLPRHRRRSELEDSNDIVEVPATNPYDGKPIISADGTPVTIQWTKAQLRAAQTQRMMGGGSSGGNAMEMAELIANSTERAYRDKDQLRTEQLTMWRQMASGDPIKRLAEQKRDLIELGIVQIPNTEKPSDYQRAVVQEVRAAGKEVFAETKEEIRPLITYLRDDLVKPLATRVLELDERTKHLRPDNAVSAPDLPREIVPIAPNDMDEIFSSLNAAATAELEKIGKKGVGLKK